MERTYNVSEAAKILGVSVKTLQRWDRDGKFVANRTPSNRRFYTEKQINDIYNDEEIIEENIKELEEAVSKMKNGSVITIEFEDECLDYITRTKWFDQDAFIVGGTGRIKTAIFTFYDTEEINFGKLLKDMEEAVGEKFMMYRRKTKGIIKVEYMSSEVFKDMKCDNFSYKNNSGYTFPK